MTIGVGDMLHIYIRKLKIHRNGETIKFLKTNSLFDRESPIVDGSFISSSILRSL